MCPKKTVPSGRARKPTANTAKVDSNDDTEPPPEKNAALRYTVE